MAAVKIFKIGGAIVDDDQKLDRFLASFSRVKGGKILVHGGGVKATDLARRLGIEVRQVDGRRITDADTIEIVTMVYAGINKKVVAKLQLVNISALGLCGADLNLIPARKRQHPEIDFGFVGDVVQEQLNVEAISGFLKAGYCPVFCALTAENGQLLNTNADTIASAIATALSVQYETELIYCFEMPGVLRDRKDEGSLIENMNRETFAQLCGEGVVVDGMIPKLENALAAVDYGVTRVRITRFDRLEAGTLITS